MDIDYRELFSEYVDEMYVVMLDDEGLELAAEYSDRGGSPETCVGVGIYESTDWELEFISEELDVSRRAMYNARRKLGLEIRDRDDSG